MVAAGARVCVGDLSSASSARSLRAQPSGELLVTDGPYMEIKEHVVGFFITGSDADELNKLRVWFSENLEKPTSFGRDTLRLGICWFKTDATKHISRIWEMVQILERNGIFVKKIRTDKPGYVIYEEDWQLVAEPFRKAQFRDD